MYFKSALIVLIGLMCGNAAAQDLSRAGNVMVQQPLIDGCTVPGGLVPITSSSGPNDAPFWCGPPPYCLTMPTGNAERCHIDPGSRERSPTGATRWPQDLTCDVTGTRPTGPTHALPGRCPVPPPVGATVNNMQNITVTAGQTVQLRVNTTTTNPLAVPTSLVMSCAGPNAGIAPFSYQNFMQYAGREYVAGAVPVTALGNTQCTVTATTAAGQRQHTYSFNVVAAAAPPPTITAAFNPTNPVVGGGVAVNVNTTNATSASWTCTGLWNGTWQLSLPAYSNTHGGVNSVGTANCTFTATGPGGTATTTASWTSRAGDGGGGDGGQVPLLECPTRLLTWSHHATCSAQAPWTPNGVSRRLVQSFGWLEGAATFRCVNGVWHRINVEYCDNGGTGD